MTMAGSERITGRWLNDTAAEGVDDTVSRLLEPHRERFAGESIVVIPDVHYPYHPSTGLVTDPDVVGAVVSTVKRTPETEVVIGCRSAPVVATEATVRALGYHRLAGRLDVDVVDLEEGDAVERALPLGDGTVTVDVPRAIDDAAVIVVPTLRTDPAFGLALGMPTLARAIVPDLSSVDGLWEVADRYSPITTLLDASFTFLGEPRASRFLLASDDLVTLDAAVGGAVERSPTYLDTRALRGVGTVESVEGFSLEAATADLPDGASTGPGGPGRFLRTAYRWYARLARDAVPPALLR